MPIVIKPDYQAFVVYTPNFTPSFGREIGCFVWGLKLKGGQAESTVHMLNWAVGSVKFLGVEFDESEDEEVAVPDAAHL